MPGKHRNRKRSKPRRIQVSIKRMAIPAGVGDKGSIAELKRILREGEPLPENWAVDIEWRNPDTKVGRSKEWQRGDWDSVLSDSSGDGGGFAQAVANALRAASGQAPLKTKAKAKPKKQLGLFDQKPKAKAKKEAKKKPTAAQVKSKRSAAAKKGWATRKAKGKTK